jgi:hypothetical protein
MRGSEVKPGEPGKRPDRGGRVDALAIRASAGLVSHGHKPLSAISNALSIAFALFMDSSYSRAGTESATMPAPA